MSKDADAFDNRFKILLTGDRFVSSVCLRVAARHLLPCSLPRAACNRESSTARSECASERREMLHESSADRVQNIRRVCRAVLRQGVCMHTAGYTEIRLQRGVYECQRIVCLTWRSPGSSWSGAFGACRHQRGTDARTPLTDANESALLISFSRGGSCQWQLQAELQECCARAHVACTGTQGDAEGCVGVRSKPAIRGLVLCSEPLICTLVPATSPHIHARTPHRHTRRTRTSTLHLS